MKRRALTLFLIGLGLYVIAFVAPVFLYKKSPRLISHLLFQEDLNVDQMAFLADYINRRYVEEIDHETLMRQALHGMTERLDPYSYLIESDEKENFDRLTSGELTGIGIEFGFRDQSMVILQVFRGGPAKDAGLKADDRFVNIAGEDVKKLINTQRIVDLIKGPLGTKVDITVFRPSENREIAFTVVRNRVEIPSVSSTILDDGIVHLKLSQFQGHSDEQVKLAFSEVTSLNGLVLDLRGNSGGRLDMAISIASFFLPQDTVVVEEHYRDRAAVVHRVVNAGPWQKLPMVVLIDKNTASASEVLAGCLQDHARATLWGQRTFGKGRVQELLALEEGKSLLKLTVARYLTPKGRDLGKLSGQRGGLEPDHLVENKNEISNDAYLRLFKSNWETLKIPGNVDEFIQKNPPQRPEGGDTDLALEKSLEHLKKMISP